MIRGSASLREALRDLEFENVCTDLPWDSLLTVFCDHQAALTLCQDRKESQRVKHIDMIHQFARDNVASGDLLLFYSRSPDNVYDVLIKPWREL